MSGLKSQLIARLTKVLKTEEEREGEQPAASSPPPPAAVPERPDRAQTAEEEDSRRREDADRRALEKKSVAGLATLGGGCWFVLLSFVCRCVVFKNDQWYVFSPFSMLIIIRLSLFNQ